MSAPSLIFMLKGSNLPFVLRPVVGFDSLYRFVGGCYLHGLMKGKGWDFLESQTAEDMFLI